MNALWDPKDDWSSSSVYCFWFRRNSLNSYPMSWVVSVVCGKFCTNFRAVVDDFGTLVPVEALQ